LQNRLEDIQGEPTTEKRKSKPQEYKQTLLLYLAGKIPWFPDHGLLTSRHRTVASPKRIAVASKIFRTCTG
jgi:hypothetical protein